jgi:YfiH family protein
VLTHAPWVVPGLRHAFLDGGESAGASWDGVLGRVGAGLPIVVPRQVHGTRVVDAVAGDAPRADGLVAARPGLLVGVVTADCVPVLLVDRRRRIAGAVHAGWRGTAAGVLEAAVEHLRRAFGTPAAEVEAVVGPAIAGCCYEVGPEVFEAFRARSGEITAPAWSEREGRRHVDLRVAARLLLHATGVRSVDLLGPCTACDRAYNSYRRDGAGTGRQLSFVGWE